MTSATFNGLLIVNTCQASVLSIRIVDKSFYFHFNISSKKEQEFLTLVSDILAATRCMIEIHKWGRRKKLDNKEIA